MIERTEQQGEAVAQADTLPVIVKPRTREEFILVPKDRFEAMQKWLASLKRNQDNPADDELIRKS